MQNGIHSLTWEKSWKAAAKAADFRQRAKKEAEAENFAAYLGLEKELKFVDEESADFSCACFKDYWLDQNSMLLDTTFSNGKYDFATIRRAYNQGWWALALRQLGQFYRFAMEAPGVSPSLS
jgi:hypothetical protein